MTISNFHTHTLFCDGADAPEEIVLTAIEKGFEALGFSGHSYLKIGEDFSMSEQNTEKYIAEINRLKEKYKDKIKIYCGVEQDYYSKTPTCGYDFVIGSVHYVLKDGEYLVVDGSVQELEGVLTKYGGDFDSFAEDYFETVSNVIEKTNADIIGHFDLILKNCERVPYTPTKRFLTSAEKAVKHLSKYGNPFEINTGAMSRGYRTTPYPLPEILKMINRENGRVIITSDCHKKENLDFGFDIAYHLATDCGFSDDRISYSLF